MKTRRASKRGTTIAADDEQSTSSQLVTDFHLQLPEDIPEDLLGDTFPDLSLANLTADDIFNLIRHVREQADRLLTMKDEMDGLDAERRRFEVDLEQALADRDNVGNELEGQAAKVSVELKSVKQTLVLVESERNALRNKVQELEAKEKLVSGNVEGGKSRVAQVEAEKRNLLGALQNLKEEAVEHEEEHKSLRTQLKEERAKNMDNETVFAGMRATQATNDFKIETLQQQLKLAQDHVDQCRRDLTTKTEEFSAYRKGKHRELAEVQSQYDSLSTAHSAAQTTLTALQKSHNEQSNTLTQTLQKLNIAKTQLADQAASFRSEAATQTRLVELLERRHEDAKQRVLDVEREWERVMSQSDDREARFRDELERERQRGDELEKKVEELKLVLEKVGSGELLPPGMDPDHSSPVRGMVGLSPTASMAGRFQKTGKTYTEVYAEYVRMQDELSRQKQESRRLEDCLAQVCAEIEDRAPVLQEQRAEYDRISLEVTQLATHLAQAMQERDSQEEKARRASEQVRTVQRENDLLQKQLSDLGMQVRYLTRQIARHSNPALPEDDDEEEVGMVPDQTDTDELITDQLLLYKNLHQLQHQNQKLLRITRELASKMESEERDYLDSVKDLESKAITEAHEVIGKLKEEVERQRLKMETYIRERDMLRKMMTQGGAGRMTAALGAEGLGPTNGSLDYERLYAESQSNFDAFRKEMGADAGQLKDDLYSARREVNHLNAALAKSSATVELYTERLRMTSESLDRQTTEINNLTKRNQQMQNSLMQAEMSSHHAQERASEASSAMETLRNECALLKAEKGLWNTVEARLAAENKSLAQESSRLTSLVANLQRIQAELERAGEAEKGRARSHLKTLEDQLTDLREQLSQERETVRHVRQQKETESNDLRSRIDRTAAELATTRESLVAAEVNQKHLQNRADDHSKQLQVLQEKLMVYERRPAVGGSHGVGDTTPSALTGDVDVDQLRAEVAELSATLKATQVDLERAKIDVAQYQAISQASETTLSEMIATHDSEKTSSEAFVTSLQTELRSLQDKLNVVHEQLTTTVNQNSELHKKLDDDRVKYENEIQLLKDTVVDMTTANANVHDEELSFKQQLRQEAENTREAQARYEREVVAHGQAMNSVTELRGQIGTLQTRAREGEHEAEKAKGLLKVQATQFQTQKDILERELNDMRERNKSLGNQNSILHDQLESITAQASRIRQVADSDVAQPGPDVQTNELQSLISFLRKENDIAQASLDLAKSQNAHQQTEIKELNAALDESRTRLAEEREKASNSAASAPEHAELLEKINQLNILRESNSTLRADSEAHAKRARLLDTQLRQLKAELDPIKEEARFAKAELEVRAGTIKHLEEDNARWKARSAQILSKYERIDPAEFQALKDEVETLQAQNTTLSSEREQLESTASGAQSRAESLKNALSQWRIRYNELSSNATAKFAEFKTQIDSLTAEKAALQTQQASTQASAGQATAHLQVQALNRQVDSLKAEVASLKATSDEEKKTLQAAFDSEKATLAASAPGVASSESEAIAVLQAERDALLTEKATWIAASTTTTGTEAAAALEQEKQSLTQDLEKLKVESEVIQKKNVRLLTDNKKFIQELKQLRAQVAAAPAPTPAAAQGPSEAELEAAKAAAVEAAVKEATDKLRAELIATAPPPAEALAEQEQRLQKKYEIDLAAALAIAKAESQDAADTTPQVEQVVAARLAEAIKDAVPKAEHDTQIQAAMERGRQEVQMKLKVKDAQAVKLNTKIKELETKLAQASPGVSSPTVTVAKPKSAAAPSATATSLPPKPAVAPASTSTPAVLPSAPAAAVGTAEAPTAVRGRGRGRGATTVGRGAARGRGGAAAGGAAAAAAAVLATVDSAAAAPGLSIIGAASGKRGRDDGTDSTGGPIAKRLRGATAGAAPS